MTSTEIKSIREEMQYSQEKLARALGCSFTTVNRWEAGTTQISPAFEKKLQQVHRDFYTIFPQK